MNFRAIRRFEVRDLSDFVLIAGPNGCGKSCVFDSVRLLKSVYGGYQPNEWQQWFGEFQMRLNKAEDLRRMFRDPGQPIRIQATIELSKEETAYLTENATAVLEPSVWQELTGQPIDRENFSSTTIATQYRQHGEAVNRRLSERVEGLRTALANPVSELALTVTPEPRLQVTPNPTMEVVFQTYEPAHLGVIDFHSSSRTYARETIGGINLSTESFDARRRQNSLYNWQGKFQNVKTDLATTYLRELVAQRAGESHPDDDLDATLRELFHVFFPDKSYGGVKPGPTGDLSFPVRLSTGEEHDIDDLSSGEKELLYGYLRLRNAAPRNSTILLDEPELHLNPALLRGLPDFYHRHIGRARRNQLWLVTHSDTLLRQAVGNSNFSVYHMTTASSVGGDGNQALEVVASDELERATLDLVGDLATYRPRAKVVILEGGGDTEFDVSMVQRLFPDFARRVNLVSGGSKSRVQELYQLLQGAAAQGALSERFYAVVDRDTEPNKRPDRNARSTAWEVYHIENYLVVPRFVRAAVDALASVPPFSDDAAVSNALRECAVSIVPRIVQERLQRHVNAQLVGVLTVGGPPGAASPVRALLPSIKGSFTRVMQLKKTLESEQHLESQAGAFREEFDDALNSDSWFRDLPGRLILGRFADQHLQGLATYVAFRNLILDQMVDADFRPPGMEQLLDAILHEEDAP